MKKYTYPIVLSIAGSDSGGGAGIQADIKTISALGGFATTVITSVTAQNTLGVRNVHVVPPQMVTDQLHAVMSDLKPDSIKIGMVPNIQIAQAIAAGLKNYPDIPLVIDPVMVSTSGHSLINADEIELFKAQLYPLATVLTPNLPEAAVLSKNTVNTLTEMELAAEKILAIGTKAVLVKGGHLQQSELTDFYLNQKNEKQYFTSKATQTSNIHGTGCSLSSAIATFLALGFYEMEAIDLAKRYISKAIKKGKNAHIGAGNGPINHFFKPKKMVKKKKN